MGRLRRFDKCLGIRTEVEVKDDSFCVTVLIEAGTDLCVKRRTKWFWIKFTPQKGMAKTKEEICMRFSDVPYKEGLLDNFVIRFHEQGLVGEMSLMPEFYLNRELMQKAEEKKTELVERKREKAKRKAMYKRLQESKKAGNK